MQTSIRPQSLSPTQVQRRLESADLQGNAWKALLTTRPIEEILDALEFAPPSGGIHQKEFRNFVLRALVARESPDRAACMAAVHENMAARAAPAGNSQNMSQAAPVVQTEAVAEPSAVEHVVDETPPSVAFGDAQSILREAVASGDAKLARAAMLMHPGIVTSELIQILFLLMPLAVPTATSALPDWQWGSREPNLDLATLRSVFEWPEGTADAELVKLISAYPARAMSLAKNTQSDTVWRSALRALVATGRPLQTTPFDLALATKPQLLLELANDAPGAIDAVSKKWLNLICDRPADIGLEQIIELIDLGLRPLLEAACRANPASLLQGDASGRTAAHYAATLSDPGERMIGTLFLHGASSVAVDHLGRTPFMVARELQQASRRPSTAAPAWSEFVKSVTW